MKWGDSEVHAFPSFTLHYVDFFVPLSDWVNARDSPYLFILQSLVYHDAWDCRMFLFLFFGLIAFI